jgi:GNAT superfamily N-acetyltransferase
MCDEWMPQIRLLISLEQFHQMPRNPAYRYEYLDGEAYLTPRPKFYHAVLNVDEFKDMAAPADIALRPFHAEDWPRLESLFVRAFARWQPFASLDEPTLLRAAQQSLKKTRTGGDGPLLESVCFLAQCRDEPIGAIILTLLPDGDPCDWSSYYWNEPPPEDLAARRQGRPHLTWIFVGPNDVGHGVGSFLLAAAVRALRDLGYGQLFSSFVLGNDSSLLWHWRNGFRLLSYPGSHRRPFPAGSYRN